ncbi:MAG TPA: hypothetical protein DCW31_09890 [Lactobacillus sp.]|nr:hypothetical protein [Lactobacillus sp.]
MNQIMLLFAALILFIDFKGLIPKKAGKGFFLTMPIIGATFTVLEFNGILSFGTLAEAIFMFFVAIIAGTLFGHLKQVTQKSDGYYIRSTWFYVIAWLVVFIGRYATLITFNIHANPLNNGWLTWFYLMTYFICRNITFARRHPEVKRSAFSGAQH